MVEFIFKLESSSFESISLYDVVNLVIEDLCDLLLDVIFNWVGRSLSKFGDFKNVLRLQDICEMKSVSVYSEILAKYLNFEV